MASNPKSQAAYVASKSGVPVSSPLAGPGIKPSAAPTSATLVSAPATVKSTTTTSPTLSAAITSQPFVGPVQPVSGLSSVTKPTDTTSTTTSTTPVGGLSLVSTPTPRSFADAVASAQKTGPFLGAYGFMGGPSETAIKAAGYQTPASLATTGATAGGTTGTTTGGTTSGVTLSPSAGTVVAKTPEELGKFIASQPSVGPTQPTDRPAPSPPSSIPGADPKFFSNIDKTTGLPILDRSVIDDALGKGNKLGPQQVRDISADMGWGNKSDASQIVRGAAVFGLKPATTALIGSETIPGSSAKQLLAVIDQINASAGKVLIDPSQYTKKVTQTTPYGGVGKTQTVPDTAGLYKAIDNLFKDTYAVSNSVAQVSQNKSAPHATILYKADKDGFLKPIIDPNTNQPMVQTYKAVSNVTSQWYEDLAPGLMMLAPFVLGPAAAALSESISGATLGGALGVTEAGTAATLGSVIGNTGVQALTNGIINAGVAAVTGGDVLKGAITGGITGAVSANAADIANKIFDQSTINKIADVVKQTPDQVTKTIASGVSSALTSAVLDPNNIGKNIIANVASSFASNEAKNLVTNNVKTDNVNVLADAAGKVAGVATKAAASGQDVTQAIENAAPGILAGVGKTLITDKRTTPAEVEERDITRGDIKTADTGITIKNMYPQLAAGEGYKVDIGGTPVLQETANELKVPLPEGTRLATFEEADKENLTATQLDNGQYAFLKPIGAAGQGPDYSTIAGQAGAGALSPIFSAVVEPKSTQDVLSSSDAAIQDAQSALAEYKNNPTPENYKNFIDKSLAADLAYQGAKDGVVPEDKTLPPVEVIGTREEEPSLPPVEVIGTRDEEPSLPPVEVIGTRDEEPSLPPVIPPVVPPVVPPVTPPTPPSIPSGGGATPSGLRRIITETVEPLPKRDIGDLYPISTIMLTPEELAERERLRRVTMLGGLSQLSGA